MNDTIQATVNIGGKERLMSFDFNAYTAIEEYYRSIGEPDKSFSQLFDDFARAVREKVPPRAADISLLVWSALYATDETVTIREVRSWINLKNMWPLVREIMAAFNGPTDPRQLAPFVPTPPAVVCAAVKALDLQPGDVLIDLGAGDGRVIEAALAEQPALNQAIAVEMDPERAALIRQKFSANPAVLVVERDINEISPELVGMANRVFLYLLTESNEKLRPMLEASLKPGTRVVSHHFEFAGWPIRSTETIEVADSNLSPHPIHTYIR